MKRRKTLPKRLQPVLIQSRRPSVMLAAVVVVMVAAIAGYVAVRPSRAAVQTIPVYRLANYITHERLFTTSFTEKMNALSLYPGWIDEGTAFYSVPSSYATAVPIYRLANFKTQERLFTASSAERDAAVASNTTQGSGWIYEGIGFYGVPSTDAAQVPVYRMANWITHERLFTTSTAEINNALANYAGWVNEGIGFYAIKQSAGSSPSPSGTATPTPTPTPTPSGTPVTFNTCTNPSHTLATNPSNPQDGITLSGYYVDTDTWNFAPYPGSAQTMYVCDYNNWYAMVNVNNNNGDGAVKTYPNVHKDFSEPKISTFTTISSLFAHTMPATGDWDAAYDVWINNYGVELMIWTQSAGRQAHVPGIPIVATTTLSGITYNIHKSGTYIAYDMPTAKTYGTINVKEIMNDMASRGYISSTATLSSIQYGVEVCNTNSVSTKFAINNFAVTAQ